MPYTCLAGVRGTRWRIWGQSDGLQEGNTAVANDNQFYFDPKYPAKVERNSFDSDPKSLKKAGTLWGMPAFSVAASRIRRGL
jgi:hypothetical protein